jgi:branched-chain amino acid transport system permease protein
MRDFHRGRRYLRGFYVWAKSAGGITVILTAVLAILASIDKGVFILTNTFVTGGMWALVAIGVALIFGVMNISNFAHGEYFMVGSMAAYQIITPLNIYLKHHPNPWLLTAAPLIAIAGATLVGAVFGLITERLIFNQLRKHSKGNWLLNCFLVTIGISVILSNGDLILFGANFRGILYYWDVPPILIFGVPISVDRMFTFCLALFLLMAFWVFMKFTRTGQAIRACSQDERGARMVGISVNLVNIVVFCLGCAFAALAGASLLFMIPSYPTVGLMPLYNSWFIIILVGLGNVEGTIPGGFIIAFLQVATRIYLGEGWENIIPMFVICLILIFKPYGIFAYSVRSVWEK